MITCIAGLTIATEDVAASQVVYDLLGLPRVTLVAGEPGLVSVDLGVEDVDEEVRLATRRGMEVADDGTFRARGLSYRFVGDGPIVGEGIVSALDHVVVWTRDVDGLLATYAGRLGLDLRLDRSFPQWGMRELFLKAGANIIEIGISLKDEDQAPAPDNFGGVAWQVPDIEVAQAMIEGAGIEVSEVRTGRKKGTRVATIRDRRCATPTLLIEPVGARA